MEIRRDFKIKINLDNIWLNIYNEFSVTKLNVGRMIGFWRNDLNAHWILDATEMTAGFNDPIIGWKYR